MTQIAVLPTPEKKREQSVLDLLTFLKSEASAGNLECLFVVSFCRDGGCHIKHTGIMSVTNKVGRLERLKFELLSGSNA